MSYFRPKSAPLLKIAVNTRLLLHNRLEGIGRFSFEILSRLAAQHPEHEFIYLFDRNFHPDFITSPNITPVVIAPQARHPLLWKIWFNYAVPRAIAKHKAELFLSSDGFLSERLLIPQVAVIHDLNFEVYPEDLRPSHSRYYRKYFPRFAKIADRLATVSEFSKNDIARRYGISADKIDVVYNAAASSFKPALASQIIDFKKKHTGGNAYFLFVGAMHPRKNIERLLLAFNHLKNDQPGSYKLVLAGNKYWWNEKIRTTFKNLQYQNDVIFTGRVSNEELNTALSGAIALTFVPYFEGFGIPILEAFACQCPVITSNVSAMPEIAADAALLADPFSVESIAAAMARLLTEKDLREQLIATGTERLKDFNWDKSANALWKTIEHCIEKS
jgi:glycosyltransferase involved in cell wall biosynthesis